MQSSSSPQAVEFKDITVDAGGKRLNARVGGTGTPIVLFHSLLADQSSWDRIVQPLASCVPIARRTGSVRQPPKKTAPAGAVLISETTPPTLRLRL